MKSPSLSSLGSNHPICCQENGMSTSEIFLMSSRQVLDGIRRPRRRGETRPRTLDREGVYVPAHAVSLFDRGD
jgi:hypothetical protein